MKREMGWQAVLGEIPSLQAGLNWREFQYRSLYPDPSRHTKRWRNKIYGVSRYSNLKAERTSGV